MAYCKLFISHLTTMRKMAFEMIVGKRDSAGNQYCLARQQQCFYNFQDMLQHLNHCDLCGVQMLSVWTRLKFCIELSHQSCYHGSFIDKILSLVIELVDFTMNIWQKEIKCKWICISIFMWWWILLEFILFFRYCWFKQHQGKRLLQCYFTSEYTMKVYSNAFCTKMFCSSGHI